MSSSLYRDLCLLANRMFSGLLRSVNLEWDKELEDAIEFIGMDLKPREIMVFAWSTSLTIMVITSFLALVSQALGINVLFVLLMGMVAAILAIYLIPAYPVRIVNFERIRCLGYAPRLIAYLIIPLKQDPNIEKAVKFAADTGDDKLTQDLKKLVWGTWAGKHASIDDALIELGQRWGGHIKGFKDALYAIRSAQVEKHESRRLDTLDRALRELLANIEVKFKEFTNELRIPTVFLFMAGVLIPMVALMFLPVLSMMGFELGKPLPVFLMLCAIIVGVYILSEFILEKRPIAFTAIRVPDDYPGLAEPGMIKIGNRETSVKKLSVGVALMFSSLSIPYFLGYKHAVIEDLNTLPVVVGVFAGFYAYFKLSSMPKLKARAEIERAEEEAIEASFHIGNRLLSSMPAEEAMIRVAEMMRAPDKNQRNTSKLSEVLDRTVKNIRYMNMTVRDALFDVDRGSLREVHSGLIRGIFKLFASSLERGVTAAAETLISTANHFREIRKVEEDLKEKMSYTTSMMKVSVTYVAPALCGMTIPLTEVFTDMLTDMQGGLSVLGQATGSVMLIRIPELNGPILTLILGFYMLMLIIILIRFTAVLEWGEDDVKIKEELAKAIPRAAMTFVVVLVLSRIFFSNMM